MDALEDRVVLRSARLLIGLQTLIFPEELRPSKSCKEDQCTVRADNKSTQIKFEGLI